MTSQANTHGAKLLIVISIACVGLYVYASWQPSRRSYSAAPRTMSQNNLRQIGIAVANYEEVHGKLPDNVRDAEGKPLLSWRVVLLPYLEQEQLFEQFKLDEPWDSDHNKSLLLKMPRLYRAPIAKGPPGFTRYLGNAHSQGMVPLVAPDKALRSEELEDGAANTLWAVEVNDKFAVEWTRPADYTPAINPTAAFTDYSQKALVVFVDGMTRVLEPSKLGPLLTRNGGEKVDPY